jgi:VanZ family protein
VIEKGRNAFFTAVKWLLVVAWAGMIWKLLTLPGDETPDISFIPFADKFGHAGLYFIWGLLICWSVQRSFRQLSRVGVGVVAVFASALYGVASEIYQAGIGRDADVLDVFADAAGALLAQYLYFSTIVRSVLKRMIAGRISAERRDRRQVLSSFAKANPPEKGSSADKGNESVDA